MAALSCPISTSEKILSSFDGITNVSFANSDTLKGFFSRFTNISTLTIGGNRNTNGTITNGWHGTIDYVIVTDEVLSQAEIDAIGKDAPSMNVEESETLEVSLTSKYSSNTLTWNAVKDVKTYQVLFRDNKNDEFKELTTTTSLRYVDRLLTANNREYKVIAGKQESEILTAKNGLESGIVYKRSHFQDRF